MVEKMTVVGIAMVWRSRWWSIWVNLGENWGGESSWGGDGERVGVAVRGKRWWVGGGGGEAVWGVR